MSEIKAEIVLIDNVETHPNADKLDIVTVKGWKCVVQRGQFRTLDKCLYIPIDSVLPQAIEEMIFGVASKVKLSKSRVKTIKLRGAISQGLVVPLEKMGFQSMSVGADMTDFLGIKKYEPPQHLGPQSGARQGKPAHPDFHKYTSIENFKNHPTLFRSGDMVVVTEKIHGTNFRCGWVPIYADTVWKKIKRWFGKLPSHEFVYGSHNVQLQGSFSDKSSFSKNMGKNVYEEAVRKYDLINKLGPGEILYGEIYGCSIQKGYAYGCQAGERKLVVFDLKVNGEYVSFETLSETCKLRDLPLVPVLSVGEYIEPLIQGFVTGFSILHPETKIREGVVVRAFEETETYLGRKILKLINDEYLLKDNTEFH